MKSNLLHRDKPAYWNFSILVISLGILTILSACSGAVAAPDTPDSIISKQDLAKTEAALKTRIAVDSGVVRTSQALQTEAASRPTPTPTTKPIPPTPIPPVQPTSPLEVLPDDVPFPPGEARDLFTSKNLFSFSMPTEFSQVVLFYQNQMPVSGWKIEVTSTFVTESSAQLVYYKPDHNVSISIRKNPISGLTGIVISLDEISSTATPGAP